MAAPTLIDLPTEIIQNILAHCYVPWSLYILNKVIRGTVAIDGLPSSTLFHINKRISHLASEQERRAFTRQLIFTTSSTQWRILSRLRTLSPTRLGWILDNIHTLVFTAPPLFTNRVPWAYLPGLQKIELDYCFRSVMFKCQGSARELEAGHLDTLIVNFARDTERFDMPLVEDAWRANKTPASPAGANESADLATTTNGSTAAANASARRIEVHVVKRMHIFESVSIDHRTTTGPSVYQSWKIRVTATHKGRLQDVRFEIVYGKHEVPFGETVIWDLSNGYRDTVPFESLPERCLSVRKDCSREELLSDNTRSLGDSLYEQYSNGVSNGL